MAKGSRIGRVAEIADRWTKLSAGALLLLALLSAIPAGGRLVKVASGTLYGVTGTAYFEFGAGGTIVPTPVDPADYLAWVDGKLGIGTDCDATPAPPVCRTLESHADYARLVNDFRGSGIGYAAYCDARPESCRIDGGLYLIKPARMAGFARGERAPGAFGWGSLMQASVAKNLRVYPRGGCGPDVAGCRYYREQPEIFALEAGECLIVRRTLDDGTRPLFARWGGWVKVTTTACGLFN